MLVLVPSIAVIRTWVIVWSLATIHKYSNGALLFVCVTMILEEERMAMRALYPFGISGSVYSISMRERSCEHGYPLRRLEADFDKEVIIAG